MKKYVRASVRPSDNGNYIFDYTYNYPEDLIHIEPPQLYRSEHGTNVYWFGYRFNDDVSSKDRTDFIPYLKGLVDPSISYDELVSLIELPDYPGWSLVADKINLRENTGPPYNRWPEL